MPISKNVNNDVSKDSPIDEERGKNRRSSFRKLKSFKTMNHLSYVITPSYTHFDKFL